MRLKTLKETITEWAKDNLGAILLLSFVAVLFGSLCVCMLVAEISTALIEAEATKTAAESLSHFELTIGGAK
jgi:hypothetical protein